MVTIVKYSSRVQAKPLVNREKMSTCVAESRSGSHVSIGISVLGGEK